MFAINAKIAPSATYVSLKIIAVIKVYSIARRAMMVTINPM
jgi:hypothetical protein